MAEALCFRIFWAQSSLALKQGAYAAICRIDFSLKLAMSIKFIFFFISIIQHYKNVDDSNRVIASFDVWSDLIQSAKSAPGRRLVQHNIFWRELT